MISPLRWGRRDLNPHASRHMILSHARLPIPTLPPTSNYTRDPVFDKQPGNSGYGNRVQDLASGKLTGT